MPTRRSTSCRTLRSAVCGALIALTSAGALAQIAPAEPPPEPPLPAQEASPLALPPQVPPPQPERPNTRSLFAATIAMLVAQGIGSGVSAGLADGLRGSILNWFRGPAKSENEAALLEASARHGASDGAERRTPARAGEPLRAGLAYEVHRVTRDGATAPVDPARAVFRTGEQFAVFYRPSLPGRVEVVNVDPAGRTVAIDRLEVAAGELASLGPYKFVGQPGDELLRIRLVPCSSARMAAATRSIVKASIRGERAEPIADCEDVPAMPVGRTRSIRPVQSEGATAFALDPVSREERATGRLAPRELTIRLQHR